MQGACNITNAAQQSLIERDGSVASAPKEPVSLDILATNAAHDNQSIITPNWVPWTANHRCALNFIVSALNTRSLPVINCIVHSGTTGVITKLD